MRSPLSFNAMMPHSVLRRVEGSALIELALLLPVFLLLFIGTVDFGRGFFAAIEVPPQPMLLRTMARSNRGIPLE